VLVQATLNGDLTRSDHLNVPLSADELARDAAACVAVGAGAIHLHPRDLERESLDAGIVDAVVGQVRQACGVAVGVSTGAWIEPDLDRRLELIRSWRAADYASVNVSEPGAQDMMRALLEVGVGIEAGVWTMQDAQDLARFDVAGQLTRILVEPVEVTAEDAVALVTDIHRALDEFDQVTPRLQHGDGAATWVLISDAIKNGHDTRIGFEDTLFGPDGTLADSNQALVRAAVHLITAAGKTTSQLRRHQP
jgi:uncharacterized protein (DUF849 family)